MTYPIPPLYTHTMDPSPPHWAAFSARKRAILLALPDHITLTAAAAHCGIDRTVVYDWAHADPDFALALQRQKTAVADRLEEELLRRAMSGTGQMPDTLGIFLLKGYRPMFRERFGVDVSATVVHQHRLDDLAPADQVALLEVAARAILAAPGPGPGPDDGGRTTEDGGAEDG